MQPDLSLRVADGRAAKANLPPPTNHIRFRYVTSRPLHNLTFGCHSRVGGNPDQGMLRRRRAALEIRLRRHNNAFRYAMVSNPYS
jgi:hypothetical protein